MSSSPYLGPGPDLRGQLLGRRYRLDELVAWGGTASVYAALDLPLRRRVAVKVLYPEHTRTESQRRRILQEAILGGRIDHPHVVSIFDLGDDETADGERRMYLVMPLVTGTSLRTVLLEGPLPWTRAVDLVVQLLAGLSAVHRAGALHRDIKPENCLITPADDHEHLRLSDLGLAKALSPDALALSRPPASTCGALLGTLAYLSPEQAQGLPLDERADLYSVGILLYELLTRRVPFTGKHLDLLNAHVSAAPPPPTTIAATAEIPMSIEAVVLRALAKDPAERFARAEIFSAALAEAKATAATVEGGAARARVAGAPCPPTHTGCEAAQASLAAWTRFEYDLALREGSRAARLNPAWYPIKLLMSDLPDEP